MFCKSRACTQASIESAVWQQMRMLRPTRKQSIRYSKPVAYLRANKMLVPIYEVGFQITVDTPTATHDNCTTKLIFRLFFCMWSNKSN